MKKIILASGSPRRKHLLSQTNISFEVVVSDYEEDNTLDMPPAKLVEHLALQKALAVAKDHPNALVIGADTLVVLNGEVLGKPKNEADMRTMIAAASGKTQSVITGLAIVDGHHVATDHSTSKLTFRTISPDEIDKYASRRDDWGDKAGAYGITHLGAVFVERIEGDTAGTLGLPLCQLSVRLREFNVSLL